MTTTTARLTRTAHLKLAAAVERVNTVNRRLAAPEMTLTVGDHTIDNLGRVWYEVTLTGSPARLNGWRFAARIEHGDTPEMTLVTAAAGVDTDPAWRTATGCDHCQTTRRRRCLYVLDHHDGRRVVVGSTCLASFVGVADAHALAAHWDDIDIIDDMAAGAGDPDDEYATGRSNGLDAREVLVVAAYLIAGTGYHRADSDRPTKDDVTRILTAPAHDRPQITAPAPVDDMITWITERADVSGDYMWNLRAAVERALAAGATRREIGLLVSLPVAYDRAHPATTDETPAAGYVGEPKERLRDLTATLVAASSVYNDYTDSEDILYRFELPGGQQISWKATTHWAPAWEIGTTVKLTATVKKHRETRRGEQVTVVTLAKVTPT